jgi:hypothetical protein
MRQLLALPDKNTSSEVAAPEPCLKRDSVVSDITTYRFFIDPPAGGDSSTTSGSRRSSAGAWWGRMGAKPRVLLRVEAFTFSRHASTAGSSSRTSSTAGSSEGSPTSAVVSDSNHRSGTSSGGSSSASAKSVLDAICNKVSAGRHKVVKRVSSGGLKLVSFCKDLPDDISTACDAAWTATRSNLQEFGQKMSTACDDTATSLDAATTKSASALCNAFKGTGKGLKGSFKTIKTETCAACAATGAFLDQAGTTVVNSAKDAKRGIKGAYKGMKTDICAAYDATEEFFDSAALKTKAGFKSSVEDVEQGLKKAGKGLKKAGKGIKSFFRKGMKALTPKPKVRSS